MKFLLISLTVLLSFGASAQYSNNKKLYKQFEKGNISKSEKLAKKILSKERENPDANLILGLIRLQKARKSMSKASQKRFIKESIANRNNIKDPSLLQYKQLTDSVQYCINNSLLTKALPPTYKKYYVGLLASEFVDTLDVYWDIFNKESYIITNTPLTENFFPQDSLRRVMLLLAQKLEGTPYKWAGESPSSGFDCSGFTAYVYKSIGIKLPHSAQKQSELIKNRKKLKDALPGDLIFFGSRNGNKIYTQHAGIIYSTDGDNIEVVHCVSNGVNIEGKDSSWDRYWINEVLFVVDVIANKEDIRSEN